MLIDTHAHIDMLENPELGIIEAREAGVKEIIIPSASEDSFERILEICHKFDDVYATLGVHQTTRLFAPWKRKDQSQVKHFLLDGSV